MTILNALEISKDEKDPTNANGNAEKDAEEPMDIVEAPEETANDCQLSNNAPVSIPRIMAHRCPCPRSQAELSQEIVNQIENEFSNRPDDDLVCRYKGSSWLDDQNIDQYMAMIKTRNMENPAYPSIYHFHCTFYTLLKTKNWKESGYASVAGYAGQDDIFSYGLVFFPCAIKGHWRMVVMDVPAKTLLLYDSLSGEYENLRCLKNIASYLKKEYERVQRKIAEDAFHAEQGNNEQDEANIAALKRTTDREINRKVKTFFDANVWTVKIVEPLDFPRQANSNDCGVFLLQFAEYLSRRLNFDFTQVHMPYFRLKMAFESFNGGLMIR